MSDNKIPRPEYPRPQMVRDNWINLNGVWEFEIDNGKSGRARKLFNADTLNGKILVPFCPESKLSGIEHKDFMNCVWYKREFDIPEDWAHGRILIHFGAVDYETEVWINGNSVGKHRGGYTSFEFDITDFVIQGTNTVTVCAEDDVRSGLQPKGKQSGEYYSHGCDYTRTTGIWQTVWLEKVPSEYIKDFKIITDPENECVHIETHLAGQTEGYTVYARILDDNENDINEDTCECKFNEVSSDNCSNGCQCDGCLSDECSECPDDERDIMEDFALAVGGTARLLITAPGLKLWEIDNPNLYEMVITLYKGEELVDTVLTYFGMRSIAIDGNAVLINGKPVFQRLVLDQGFYPDGIYTAPTDEDLKNDIIMSKNLGFNGARLHQKVFEPRYLYWADKLGYIVWGEYGSWGLNITNPMGLERFLPEWIEAVDRDYNHPAIVGWCPFNETWDLNGTKQDNNILEIVYNVTKAMDKTRPVIDTSGNFHVVTDIFDVHDYDQNPETFKQRYEPMKTGGKVYEWFPDRQKYEGQPYFVSEYGGIWWQPGNKQGWGYGKRPESEEEFIERYKGLTEALLNNPKIFGFCYTQLYDVEQEVNGLYTYDRKPKFDPEIIKAINSQIAAIEKI